MSGEKEVIAQAKELLKIEDKATEILDKLLKTRFQLGNVYGEINELEKQYERFVHVRHSEEEWTQLKKEIEEKYMKAYKELIELYDLVFDAFF